MTGGSFFVVELEYGLGGEVGLSTLPMNVAVASDGLCVGREPSLAVGLSDKSAISSGNGAGSVGPCSSECGG